ncbi:MAG: hypothetical protein F4X97_03230 [Boseongicola sp. SB0662_bin_57]|nr:hypothetical protein [Boseongicola sp. SB0662_bin_57]
MSATTEAFARVRIEALLADAGWDLTDGSSVLFEHALPFRLSVEASRREADGDTGPAHSIGLRLSTSW